jgi:hypothetical protein
LPDYKHKSLSISRAQVFKPQELPTIAIFQFASNQRQTKQPLGRIVLADPGKVHKPIYLPKLMPKFTPPAAKSETPLKLPSLKQPQAVFNKEPAIKPAEFEAVNLIDNYTQLPITRIKWHKLNNALVNFSHSLEPVSKETLPKLTSKFNFTSIKTESFFRLPLLKQPKAVFSKTQALKPGYLETASLVDVYIKQLQIARLEWHRLHNELINLSRSVELISEGMVPREVANIEGVIKAKEELDKKTKEVLEQFGEGIVKQLLEDRGERDAVIIGVMAPVKEAPLAQLPLKDLALPAQEPIAGALENTTAGSTYLENLREMFKRNLLLTVTVPMTSPLDADYGEILRLKGRNSFSGEHAGGIR